MEEDEDGYHFEDGDTIDELETSYSYRSTTFLKVLCILTWIYGLISIFLFVTYFWNTNNIIVFSKGIGDNQITYITFSYLILPLICAAGAVLMFLRNKWGFVVYLFGQLPQVIYSAYKLFGENRLDPVSIVPFMVVIAFPIGFVIMYSTQLYVMKPLFGERPSKFE